jgi:hypothetical protein
MFTSPIQPVTKVVFIPWWMDHLFLREVINGERELMFAVLDLFLG